MNKKIAITMPALNEMGGVATYYKSILPHLRKYKSLNIVGFYLGSKIESFSLFHPVTDQIRFEKFLNQKKPDLIHINPSLNLKSFLRDGLLIYQAKKVDIPVLVFFHGWEKSFETIVNNKLKWFFNHTYLKADKIIVLGSEFKYKLMEWGVKSDIILGTTTVDDSLLKTFDIKKKQLSTNRKEAINILFLSRIEKEKGIFETIDAFEILLDKSYNVKLSIAGDGSALKDAVKYIKKKKIPENRFSFLGYVSGDSKIKVFKEHHIYCFPTYYGEGMPTSVLEAMAFGIPVITRPVGGLKDFFQNGKMGFFVKGKTPGEIAVSMEKLINDKQMFNTISRYNYNFASKNFMASISAEKLKIIYRSMV